jgi:hypothetical protein
MRIRVALLALVLAATGCGKTNEGIAAFHAGEFDRAIGLLDKAVKKATRATPSLEVSIDEGTAVEQALAHATQPYFQVWQAYAGSLIGLLRVEDGCAAIATALRPIAVTVKDAPGSGSYDPSAGESWPPEVHALRIWRLTLPCP